MSKRHLLDIAEYISLISSVAGSAVAVASGQVIYATAPLSLSILLNLVNRYRFEQQAWQTNNAAIIKGHQQLAAEIQSVRSVVLASPTQAELKSIHQALSKLSGIANEQTRIQSLAPLSALDLEPINEEISQLASQYTILSGSLATIRQQLDNSPQLEKNNPSDELLYQLYSEFVTQNTKIDKLLSLSEAIDIKPIHKEISQLREQHLNLQEFLDNLVYQLLENGVIESRISSSEADSHFNRIIQRYKEEKESRLRIEETDILSELMPEDDEEWNDEEINALLELTQENEPAENEWDDEDINALLELTQEEKQEDDEDPKSSFL